MDKYVRLYNATQTLRKMAAAGDVAKKGWELWRGLAHKGGPVVGKGLTHAMLAAPVVGGVYVGAKGYQKGKRKVREIKARRQLKKMQRGYYG
jgi:hypothetical protein